MSLENLSQAGMTVESSRCVNSVDAVCDVLRCKWESFSQSLKASNGFLDQALRDRHNFDSLTVSDVYRRMMGHIHLIRHAHLACETLLYDDKNIVTLSKTIRVSRHGLYLRLKTLGILPDDFFDIAHEADDLIKMSPAVLDSFQKLIEYFRVIDAESRLTVPQE